MAVAMAPASRASPMSALPTAPAILLMENNVTYYAVPYRAINKKIPSGDAEEAGTSVSNPGGRAAILTGWRLPLPPPPGGGGMRGDSAAYLLSGSGAGAWRVKAGLLRSAVSAAGWPRWERAGARGSGGSRGWHRALSGAGVRPGPARPRCGPGAPAGRAVAAGPATTGREPCAPRPLRERYRGTGWRLCATAGHNSVRGTGFSGCLCLGRLALVGGCCRVAAEFTDRTALSLNSDVSGVPYGCWFRRMLPIHDNFLVDNSTKRQGYLFVWIVTVFFIIRIAWVK